MRQSPRRHPAPAGETPEQRHARLRARAKELGFLAEPIGPVEPPDPEMRRRVIEGFRGIGPVLDDLIDEMRGGPR